jgi:hypothetical protein
MGTVAEDVNLIEILACGHVAQRKSFADQRRLFVSQRMHVLNHLNAKPALEQRRRDGRGGDGLELVAGGFGEGWHDPCPSCWSFRGARERANPVSQG